MTYKELCAENRQLYAELESCSYKLKELHPVYHEERFNSVTRIKRMINESIAFNLEMLEDFLKSASDRSTIEDRNRKAIRIPVIAEREKILNYYFNNLDKPIASLASFLDMPKNVVDWVITEHLVAKFNKMR